MYSAKNISLKSFKLSNALLTKNCVRGVQELREEIPGRKNLTAILKNIKVTDVLEKKKEHGKGIIFMDKDETVYNAIREMKNQNLGAVLIKDKPIAGIFTERDYLRKLVLNNRSSKTTTLKEVMCTKVAIGKPDYDLDKCCSIIAKIGKRHLPIIDTPGETITKGSKLLGMISAKDSLQYLNTLVENENIPILDEKLKNVFNVLGRTSSPECYIEANSTVFEGLQEMKKHNIGGLFVHEGQRLVGIFTERDYLEKIILEGRTSKETKIQDVMNLNMEFVNGDTPVREVLSIMARKGIQTLPVIPSVGMEIDDSSKEELVGIVTSMDLLRFLEHEEEPSMMDIQTASSLKNLSKNGTFEPLFEKPVVENRNIHL